MPGPCILWSYHYPCPWYLLLSIFFLLPWTFATHLISEVLKIWDTGTQIFEFVCALGCLGFFFFSCLSNSRCNTQILLLSRISFFQRGQNTTNSIQLKVYLPHVPALCVTRQASFFFLLYASALLNCKFIHHPIFSIVKKGDSIQLNVIMLLFPTLYIEKRQGKVLTIFKLLVLTFLEGYVLFPF